MGEGFRLLQRVIAFFKASVARAEAERQENERDEENEGASA